MLVPAVRKAVSAVRKEHPAGDAGGHLLLRHPELVATYRRWGRDEDIWVRRSGILGFLVPLRDREKHDRFFGVFAEIADEVLSDPQFFVRKAIGWVLRESGKREPDAVHAWLVPRVFAGVRRDVTRSGEIPIF